MRTLVIGDIHGAYKALIQCLERCQYNPLMDTVIILGDVCDGWPYVKECVETLKQMPKKALILGNHDVWAMQWASSKGVWQDNIWVSQGGSDTLRSFNFNYKEFPAKFFDTGTMLISRGKQVFVHGGIEPMKSLNNQCNTNCLWDRELIRIARNKHNQKPDFKYGNWDDIFVGHTTTQLYKSLKPLHYCNVWMLDTGAGWNGKLTIMDVSTKEYWQSDLVTELYPNIRGRE